MNRFALAVALTMAGSLASAATFTEEGEVRRACGGVGVEDRAQMRALRSEANLELLFVQGKRGGYVADVSVRIAAAGRTPFTFAADGPMCVFRLPAGRWSIEASLEGVARRATVQVGAGAAPARAVFTFPAEAWDGIRVTDEERKSGRE